MHRHFKDLKKKLKEIKRSTIIGFGEKDPEATIVRLLEKAEFTFL